MTSFDIINAVMNAYALIWRERFYLMRMAFFPFLLACVNFTLIGLIEADTTPLRRGLMLLPAIVAEGWVIAQFLRTVMTGERWPLQRPEAGKPISLALVLRVRGLLSGWMFYVLLAVVLNAVGGVIATLYDSGKLEELANAGDPLYMIGNTLVIILTVRWFKLFWGYIPLIINVPLSHYLRATRGFGVGVHMCGLWLAATTPIMAAGLVLITLLSPLAGVAGPAGFIGYLLVSVINAMAQIGISLASSVAMTLALMPLIFGKTEGKRDV